MQSLSLLSAIVVVASFAIPSCGRHEVEHEHAPHKVVVTSATVQDVLSTQQYVCQIHSCRHIDVRALESGYLEAISIKEGQTVEKGDSLFTVVPVLYQARLDTEIAEVQLVQIEFNNTKKLFEQNVVSQQELALVEAKLARAQAKLALARAEFNFTDVKAPFGGIVDRLRHQQGSLISEGDILTTLSDNSLMWVYFNVPEARYLEYKNEIERDKQDVEVRLKLANGQIFDQIGNIGAIEADFNNQTGNIAFRADFPNPERLLRHGQTGTVLLNRVIKSALVIPQRATFEILDKRYVWTIDENNIASQREIKIKLEQDDIFVLDRGLAAGEEIVLEGVRQIREGDAIEAEKQDATEVAKHLKYHAE